MPFPERAQQFVLFIGLLHIREALSKLGSPQIVRSNRLISRIFPKKALRKAPVSSAPPSFSSAGALLLLGFLNRADAGSHHARARDCWVTKAVGDQVGG